MSAGFYSLGDDILSYSHFSFLKMTIVIYSPKRNPVVYESRNLKILS